MPPAPVNFTDIFLHLTILFHPKLRWRNRQAFCSNSSSQSAACSLSSRPFHSSARQHAARRTPSAVQAKRKRARAPFCPLVGPLLQAPSASTSCSGTCTAQAVIQVSFLSLT